MYFCTYQLLSESGLNIESIKKIHDYESWITVFDSWNPDVVYSGGDDCKLFLRDLRDDTKKKIGNHDAGVTSLLSDNFNEHHLFSGRYVHCWKHIVGLLTLLRNNIFTFVRMPFYKKKHHGPFSSQLWKYFSVQLWSHWMNTFWWRLYPCLHRFTHAILQKNICSTFLGPYGCQSCSGIRITTAQNYVASLMTY